MVSWRQFEQEAPELSRLAGARFASSELIMLGTIRPDGSPRISPCEYTIFEGDFVMGMMWQSKKALDLLRDPRCTIHSTTSSKDGKQGDAKLHGSVRKLEEERLEPYWQHIFDETGWRAEGPAHVFVFDLQSASYTVFEGDGTMHWLTYPGGEWRTQRSS